MKVIRVDKNSNGCHRKPIVAFCLRIRKLWEVNNYHEHKKKNLEFRQFLYLYISAGNSVDTVLTCPSYRENKRDSDSSIKAYKRFCRLCKISSAFCEADETNIALEGLTNLGKGKKK